MLRKSVGCAKVPCVPPSSGRLPGGICHLAARVLPAGPVVQSSGGHAGGGLYLDVSIFSSLKLLQCSITFLEATGDRGLAGGLGPGEAKSIPADQAAEFFGKYHLPDAA